MWVISLGQSAFDRAHAGLEIKLGVTILIGDEAAHQPDIGERAAQRIDAWPR
ncbi:MAG: hypothetical protein MO852_11405 [Candidatus Devosia euplotis]|nr:hypothetical protein [Candidatus Devosia euplotis]